MESTGTENEKTTPPISKNKQRKLRYHDMKQEHRKRQRAHERLQQKLNHKSNGKGNDEKLLEREKLERALVNGPKLVIDCQFQDLMSLKEKSRFAQQLRRAYSSNRKSEEPLHLILAGMSKECELYRVCCKQNDGFEKYLITVKEESVRELFEEVVYLSPDASECIDLEKGFEADKVYVIGGLVDETTNKNQSVSAAQSIGAKCVRLPIDEYFEFCGEGTAKKVLSLNQVVDIVVAWHRTHDWVQSISSGLAQRTGFKVKEKVKCYATDV